MEIRIKINIVNELGEPFMGPGPLRLLEKISECKSISKATKEMNLSYVKALKMLNGLEKNVGQQLLIRKRGGNKRGGTELTLYAVTYIKEYRRLDDKMKSLADREFARFSQRI